MHMINGCKLIIKTVCKRSISSLACSAITNRVSIRPPYGLGGGHVPTNYKLNDCLLPNAGEDVEENGIEVTSGLEVI